jgi:hypothetical protein
LSGQPDFSTRPKARQLPRWETLTLVGGALAIAAAGGLAWRARDQAEFARSRVADVRRERDLQAARVRALVPQGRGAANGREPASPARVIAAVAAALPGDVRLERLTIDYTRGTALEMAVEARDAAGWDLLLERLERAPELADVAPGPESREAEVRSVIRARWSGVAR